MARLREYFKSDVSPALMKKFGYKSVMQIPKIDKIVVNVGCGDARENATGQPGAPSFVSDSCYAGLRLQHRLLGTR